MKNMVFAFIIMMITSKCENNKNINKEGVVFYFNNSPHIYYYLPLEEGGKGKDIIDDIRSCKKGYQFFSTSSVFEDSIEKKVLFKQQLTNILNEGLDKDTIFISRVNMLFDYSIRSTYKNEMVHINQGRINLNFNCFYINEVNIKYLK